MALKIMLIQPYCHFEKVYGLPFSEVEMSIWLNITVKESYRYSFIGQEFASSHSSTPQ